MAKNTTQQLDYVVEKAIVGKQQGNYIVASMRLVGGSITMYGMNRCLGYVLKKFSIADNYKGD
ncbi:MAG: hypothetical protein ACOYIT_07685 [Christensenellales bacterium]|jgi:hypothetical protein